MQDEFNDIENSEADYFWKSATFIFDTSSLLNLYQYSESTIQDITLNIFDHLKNRIFVPNSVYEEFKTNRHKLIDGIQNEYLVLEKSVENIENNIKEIRNKIKNKDTHPYFSDDVMSTFNDDFNSFKAEISQQIGKRKELIANEFNDKIFELIENKFEIGNRYIYSRVIEIIKEGEFRYRNEIPPGYKDINKSGFQKYGDLIIWKQILDYAKGNKKSIIFIIDDIKEDWWILDKKRTPLFPRQELIKEFQELSQRKILMYPISVFIKKSRELLDIKIKQESIDNISMVEEEKNSLPREYNGIELSADDEQRRRLYRLKDVASFYCNNIHNINIHGLHDHEGELTVYWKKPPTEKDKRVIEMAWDNHNEWQIEHVID